MFGDKEMNDLGIYYYLFYLAIFVWVVNLILFVVGKRQRYRFFNRVDRFIKTRILLRNFTLFDRFWFNIFEDPIQYAEYEKRRALRRAK